MSTSGGTGSGTLRSTTRLTAAQLATIAAAPITLVAAPPSGLFVLPHRLVLRSVFGTRPFASDPNGSQAFVITPTAVADPTNVTTPHPPAWPASQFGQALTTASLTLDVIDTGIYNVAFTAGYLGTFLFGPTIGKGGADAAITPATVDHLPLLMQVAQNLDEGVVATSHRSAAGTGYAVNDTLGGTTIGVTDIFGTNQPGPTFKVTGIGGGGAVTTYTMLSAGTVRPGSGVGTVYALDGATQGVAPQPGTGTGLTITVDTVSPGDGSLVAELDYSIELTA